MMATVAAVAAGILILASIIVMAPTFRRDWWATHRLAEQLVDLYKGLVEFFDVNRDAMVEAITDALSGEREPVVFDSGFSIYDPEEEERQRRLRMYAEIGLAARAKEPDSVPNPQRRIMSNREPCQWCGQPAPVSQLTGRILSHSIPSDVYKDGRGCPGMGRRPLRSGEAPAIDRWRKTRDGS